MSRTLMNRENENITNFSLTHQLETCLDPDTTTGLALCMALLMLTNPVLMVGILRDMLIDVLTWMVLCHLNNAKYAILLLDTLSGNDLQNEQQKIIISNRDIIFFKESDVNMRICQLSLEEKELEVKYIPEVSDHFRDKLNQVKELWEVLQLKYWPDYKCTPIIEVLGAMNKMDKHFYTKLSMWYKMPSLYKNVQDEEALFIAQVYFWKTRTGCLNPLHPLLSVLLDTSGKNWKQTVTIIDFGKLFDSEAVDSRFRRSWNCVHNGELLSRSVAAADMITLESKEQLSYRIAFIKFNVMEYYAPLLLSIAKTSLKHTSAALTFEYLEQLKDNYGTVLAVMCQDRIIYIGKSCNIHNFRRDSMNILEKHLRSLLHIYRPLKSYELSEQCDMGEDQLESLVDDNSPVEKNSFLFRSGDYGHDLAGSPKQSNAAMNVQNQKAEMYSDAGSKQTSHLTPSHLVCLDAGQSAGSVPSAVVKSPWMSKHHSVTDESKVTIPTTILSSKMSSANGCLATQSVPNVSATDNDLWKTEFTPVCFGAQENSVVDVGLVCQGELTSVQYSSPNDHGFNELPILSPLKPSPKGCKVLLSNVPEVFSVGDRVPCPSGVVQERGQERGFPLYYKQQAFCVVEVCVCV